MENLSLYGRTGHSAGGNVAMYPATNHHVSTQKFRQKVHSLTTRPPISIIIYSQRTATKGPSLAVVGV